MDIYTQDSLNLNPRSEEELRGIVTSFELKWQNKMRNRYGGDHKVQL